MAAMHPPAAAPEGEAKVLDEMSAVTGWESEKENTAEVKVSVDGGSLRIDYDFKEWRWVQVKKTFAMDIRNFSRLKFRVRGEGARNQIEAKIEDLSGTTLGKKVGSTYTEEKWRTVDEKLKDLPYMWGGDGKGEFDWKNLAKVFFVISKTEGGKGTIWVDDLRLAQDSLEAPKPQAAFTYVKGNPEQAKKAAEWIASMQQPSGMILSYEGDHFPFAWLYDQALCLIVLAREKPEGAKKLLDALQKLQKPDGYWHDGYVLDMGKTVTVSEEDKGKWLAATTPGVLYEVGTPWVGSIAWIVHAIDRYAKITGDKSYDAMMKKAGSWLAKQQRKDGSLHDVTEGNFDAWWALRAAGQNAAAERVKKYLLGPMWKESEGRFIVAPGNLQPYLDCQTWGASFAAAAGAPNFGLRSLAFAKRYLECTTLDKLTKGFDATGPYSVWNEGTLQYVCAGGEGAADYLGQVNKQQRADGALQHSHEDYSRGGAWHTVMYGVCPTAWLYFANVGEEPFPAGA